MQDVFFEIFNKAGQFDPAKGSAKTWIVQYAYHRILNRRQYLADPTMQAQDDPLAARARAKMHTSREGAAGGDGEPAGGGCGCGN